MGSLGAGSPRTTAAHRLSATPPQVLCTCMLVPAAAQGLAVSSPPAQRPRAGSVGGAAPVQGGKGKKAGGGLLASVLSLSAAPYRCAAEAVL